MCVAIISQQMAGAQWSFREISLWRRDSCYVQTAMLPGRHFSRAEGRNSGREACDLQDSRRDRPALQPATDAPMGAGTWLTAAAAELAIRWAQVPRASSFSHPTIPSLP